VITNKKQFVKFWLLSSFETIINCIKIPTDGKTLFCSFSNGVKVSKVGKRLLFENKEGG